MRLTSCLFLAMLPFLLPPAIAATTAYSMPRTQVIPLQDKETGGRYELYIKLPENYKVNEKTHEAASSDSAPLKHYPVIYTTDAVWHMDLLSGVTEFLMPDVILVGISWQQNMPEEIDYGHRRAFASRFKDYSFVEHEKPKVQAKYNFGQGNKHLRFIREDVIGYVEKHYRTSPNNRAYLSYSMGAEFGAYILLHAPHTFNQYILGSPSFDATSFEFLRTLQSPLFTQSQQSNNPQVFVSIGELETERMKLTQQFVDLLRNKGGQGLSTSGLNIIADSDHASAVPDTFSKSIRWLESKASGQL